MSAMPPSFMKVYVMNEAHKIRLWLPIFLIWPLLLLILPFLLLFAIGSSFFKNCPFKINQIPGLCCELFVLLYAFKGFSVQVRNEDATVDVRIV